MPDKKIFFLFIISGIVSLLLEEDTLKIASTSFGIRSTSRENRKNGPASTQQHEKD